MAGELIWSRAALDDIEAIAAFIARDSLIHARCVVEQIIAGGERLLAQPALGEPAPESSQDRMHEHHIHGFRILFERQGQDVHLLAVVHGRGRPLAETPSPRPARIAARPAVTVAHENPWLASPAHDIPRTVVRDPLDDFHDLE